MAQLPDPLVDALVARVRSESVVRCQRKVTAVQFEDNDGIALFIALEGDVGGLMSTKTSSTPPPTSSRTPQRPC
jgi:hypothetical protein